MRGLSRKPCSTALRPPHNAASAQRIPCARCAQTGGTPRRLPSTAGRCPPPSWHRRLQRARVVACGHDVAGARFRTRLGGTCWLRKAMPTAALRFVGAPGPIHRVMKPGGQPTAWVAPARRAVPLHRLPGAPGRPAGALCCGKGPALPAAQQALALSPPGLAGSPGPCPGLPLGEQFASVSAVLRWNIPSWGVTPRRAEGTP